MEVCYEVWSPVGETPRVLFTRATTTIVLVDSATMKPRRITDEERLAVDPYLEPMMEFSKKN
jgi:acyl-CoA thioester hydrolase